MSDIDRTQPDKPNNHMVMAIVSTVVSFCGCFGLIPGIISIVFASQVNSKYNNGDYEGAEKASKNAKIFWIIALAITVIVILYYVISFGANWDEFMEQFNAEMERQRELQGQ